MLVRGSNGSYAFIDFRETCPSAGFQDMYKNNTKASILGGLARYESYTNYALKVTYSAVAFRAKFEALRIFTKITAGSHGSKLCKEQ